MQRRFGCPLLPLGKVPTGNTKEQKCTGKRKIPMLQNKNHILLNLLLCQVDDFKKCHHQGNLVTQMREGSNLL